MNLNYFNYSLQYLQVICSKMRPSLSPSISSLPKTIPRSYFFPLRLLFLSQENTLRKIWEVFRPVKPPGISSLPLLFCEACLKRVSLSKSFRGIKTNSGASAKAECRGFVFPTNKSIYSTNRFLNQNADRLGRK